jgi:hypothetical protein
METTSKPLMDTILRPERERDVTRLGRLFRAVERDASPAVIVVAFAVVLANGLAGVLEQDGWLALVSGREISRHGLPSTDHLTMWSAGTRWIDQQWLGHLGIYGLDALGGLRLLLISHALLVVFTFALAIVAARRLGGSPRATALVAIVAFLPVISTISELRTQLPASTLFVLTMWLLITESRKPSARVYLALPLLVVWANVHGSVVFGAGLTMLAGLVFAWEQFRRPAERRFPRWRERSLALVAGPIVCTFASPYGLSLLGYYHRTLLNGSFGKFVTEWRPTTLTAENVPVFLLACGGLWLLGRAGSRVSLFERLAFAFAVVGAFLAVRNVGWLGLSALLVLPRVADTMLPRRTSVGASPVRLGLAVAAVVGTVLAATTVLRAPGPALAEHYPARASDAVARALDRNPQARVFADVHFADWLLWRIPQSRGRVAFDARFELLSRNQLERLYRWAVESTDRWRSAAAGTSIAVVDRPHDKLKTAALLRSGARVLYATREVAVLALPPAFGRASSAP